VPAVKDAAWARGDIDRFLLAKREAKGIRPVGDAAPRTLIRRLYYDLIGCRRRRSRSSRLKGACCFAASGS